MRHCLLEYLDVDLFDGLPLSVVRMLLTPFQKVVFLILDFFFNAVLDVVFELISHAQVVQLARIELPEVLEAVDSNGFELAVCMHQVFLFHPYFVFVDVEILEFLEAELVLAIENGEFSVEVIMREQINFFRFHLHPHAGVALAMV